MDLFPNCGSGLADCLYSVASELFQETEDPRVYQGCRRNPTANDSTLHRYMAPGHGHPDPATECCGVLDQPGQSDGRDLVLCW